MLTDRQTRFIEEYLRAPSDAAGAALRAGYSPGRARRQARALLEMPEVRQRIEREREREAGRDAGVCPERVIRELARIAFADPADFFAGPVEHPLSPGAERRDSSPSRGSQGAGACPAWGSQEEQTSLPRPLGRGGTSEASDGEGRPAAPGASPRPTDDVGAAVPGASPRPTNDVGAAAPGASPRPTDDVGGPLPAGLLPGSGTGLKLKYTPKRGADGETVFELSMEREVRVGDKLRALELLSKYLGLGVPPAAGDGGDADHDGPAAGVVILPEIEAEVEE